MATYRRHEDPARHLPEVVPWNRPALMQDLGLTSCRGLVATGGGRVMAGRTTWDESVDRRRVRGKETEE